MKKISTQISLPYMWRKYMTLKGKERLMLVRCKSDNLKYHRGKIPKGCKIKQDILNTKEDAMKTQAIVKSFARKKKTQIPKIQQGLVQVPQIMQAPQVIQGGFLGSLPIIGPILASLFGSGFSIKKFDKGEHQKINESDILKIKQILDVDVIQDLLKENSKTINMKATKANAKKLYSMIMQILNDSMMQGGLIGLPFSNLNY